MSAPVLVQVVKHRMKNAKGKPLGHVAYVQERDEASIAKFGGKRWAAWARRTVDGVETGTPERFDTYDFEGDAMAHALYAAGCPTPTVNELLETGRRMP